MVVAGLTLECSFVRCKLCTSSCDMLDLVGLGLHFGPVACGISSVPGANNEFLSYRGPGHVCSGVENSKSNSKSFLPKRCGLNGPNSGGLDCSFESFTLRSAIYCVSEFS